MTFEEYLLKKFPLYRQMNYDDIKLSFKDIKKLIESWQQELKKTENGNR